MAMDGEQQRRMEGQRRVREAAEILLEARRTCEPIAALPEGLRPASLEEAYALQDLLALAFAPVGGWKIGAASPEAEPVFAPMPLWGGYLTNGEVLGPQYARLRGVEAELAFLLGSDLPARAEPYSREEVIAAVESVHPAVEILESAFVDPDAVDRFSMMGDLQLNGGFAFGPPLVNWLAIDLREERVEVVIDGAVRRENGMENTAGPDLLRLLVYLANQGAGRTGGLRAGQWITTGSWMGKQFASASSTVRARFSSFGLVSFSFA